MDLYEGLSVSYRQAGTQEECERTGWKPYAPLPPVGTLMPDKLAIEQAYATLGLEPGATMEEIRRAYLALVKVWHPDRFPLDPHFQKDAQEKIKTINQAYTQLCAIRPEERVQTAQPGRQFHRLQTPPPLGKNHRAARRSAPPPHPWSMPSDWQRPSSRQHQQTVQAESRKPARVRGEMLLFGVLVLIIMVQVLSAIFPWFTNLLNPATW
jgi:hypothetical protein